jgi:hypothetical protein
MYAPVLNQIGPALIARGYEGAADYSMQGSKALAAGISSAGSSIGNAVADAAAKWQKEAKQADQNAGVATTYHAMNEQAKQQTGHGIMPDSWWEALAKTNNKNEQSGMLMGAAPNFDSYLQTQHQVAVQQAAQKDQFTPQYYDAGGVPMVTTSRGSAMPVPRDHVQNSRVVSTAGGYVSVDPATGQTIPLKDDAGNPVMPPAKAAADPARAAQISALDSEIADLSGKIAGGDKKWGPDWLPIGTPYADQLRAKQAEKAALVAGGGAPAAVAAPAAADAGGGYANPGAVKAAVLSGQLTPQQGQAILKSQFGFQ